MTGGPWVDEINAEGDGPGAPEPAADGERASTELVIVTGLSGAGRSTVARALENVGFYVVDNLPQSLMVTMAELAFESGGAARRTAMILDVRSRAFSTDLTGAVADLRERGFVPRVLFVDASDEELIRRFESVRRNHPLQGKGRLADGIAAERNLLLDARGESDLILDTTLLNVNQLRARVEDLFGGEGLALHVTVLSFGFKYGLPADADLVVDMRFLPNPHWVPELRPLTGRDAPVSDYVLSQEGARTFIAQYADLVAQAAKGFEREGKRYLTIAVGCTGGKHRSVATTEALAAELRTRGLHAHTVHRDLGRE
ncbi:MAG: RNase adapter protein RapZ [Cryptosporangiaceae bacterium]|nr:RNase adapter protein RapZ [Cryptosporangiaceae bacterium]